MANIARTPSEHPQAEQAVAAAAEFAGQAARLRTQVEAEQRLGGLLAGLRAAEQGAAAQLQVSCVCHRSRSGQLNHEPASTSLRIPIQNGVWLPP
jgi:hypothetical protein